MVEGHDAGCEGVHTDAISCTQAKKIRAAARVNVWICVYGRNGYHSFDTDDPSEVCTYEGCTRTRAELLATLWRSNGCRSPVCSVSPYPHARQPGCPS